MIVYYEIIFLINSIMHVSFVKLAAKINNLYYKKQYLLLSLFASNIYLYLIVNQRDLVYTKFIVLLSTSLLIFEGKIIQKASATVWYLVLNILLGGLTEVFYVYSNIYISLFFFAAIVLFFEVINQRRTITPPIYHKITIEFNHKLFNIDAFLDTGHSLREEYPIIFMHERYDIHEKEHKRITVNTIVGSKEINLYKPKKIVLREHTIKAYVSFVKMEYDCLFGIDLLRGIKS